MSSNSIISKAVFSPNASRERVKSQLAYLQDSRFISRHFPQASVPNPFHTAVPEEVSGEIANKIIREARKPVRHVHISSNDSEYNLAELERKFRVSRYKLSEYDPTLMTLNNRTMIVDMLKKKWYYLNMLALLSGLPTANPLSPKVEDLPSSTTGD